MAQIKFQSQCWDVCEPEHSENQIVLGGIFCFLCSASSLRGGRLPYCVFCMLTLAATVENRQKEKRKKKYFTSHRGETNLTKEKRKFHQPRWRNESDKRKKEKKKFTSHCGEQTKKEKRKNFTVERRI